MQKRTTSRYSPHLPNTPLRVCQKTQCELWQRLLQRVSKKMTYYDNPYEWELWEAQKGYIEYHLIVTIVKLLVALTILYYSFKFFF
jgi:hypothetical protein